MTPEQFLSKPTTPYSDWFGEGDSHTDYKNAVGIGPAPEKVFQSDHMLLLVWPDRYVVTGYDGSEYCHTYEFGEANHAD